MTDEEKSTWDKAKDMAEGAYDKAKEMGSEAVDKVEELGSEAMDKASEMASAAGDMASDAGEAVANTAEDAWDATAGAADAVAASASSDQASRSLQTFAGSAASTQAICPGVIASFLSHSRTTYCTSKGMVFQTGDLNSA